MKQIVDLNTWKRREYFDFFNQMDDPFWGVVTKVNFTSCYKQCKEKGGSFFLYSLHKILTAANAIEEFHYQIEENQIVRHDTIHLSPTIGREDGTFGFGFFEYFAEIDVFIEKAKIEIDRVQNCSGIGLSALEVRSDTIFYSSVPWFSFSEMKHAKSFRGGDGTVRISTGKLELIAGEYLMDLSLDAHHGLMDGRHAGLFFDLLNR